MNTWNAAYDDSDGSAPRLTTANAGTATADRSDQTPRETYHILRDVVAAGAIRTVVV